MMVMMEFWVSNWDAKGYIVMSVHVLMIDRLIEAYVCILCVCCIGQAQFLCYIGMIIIMK